MSLWMVREGKNACDECSLNECTSCECLRLFFNNAGSNYSVGIMK